MLNLIVCI